MAGGKETPRQKMIGMMYLVLTALLALNISKEVLNGFVKVENGLRSTQNTITDKVDDTFGSLKAKYLNNQEKVGPFYNKAEEITIDANNLVTYINQLKARCMSTSEGDFLEQEPLNFEKYFGKDQFGRDTVLNLMHIQKKDEYQALTTFMVGSEPSDPIDKEWSAKALRTSLEKYRDDLINTSLLITKEIQEHFLRTSRKT